MRRYHVTTFGCQMNAHDSERIKGMLEELGLGEAATPDEADVVVFNTCTIREKPDTKLAAYLGEAAARKREDPDRVIAVGGCYAEAQRERIFELYPAVDVAFGPGSIAHLGEWLGAGGIGVARGRFGLDDRDVRGRAADAPRALLPGLGAGLDGLQLEVLLLHRPGRARPRAEPPARRDRRRGARASPTSGVHELTLLGQNVNSWGRDLLPDIRTEFGELLRACDAVDGIERIRFTSPHPKDFRDPVIAAIAECAAVCEHVHLPLQSGSSRILKAMRRTYTRERYLALVEKHARRDPRSRARHRHHRRLPGRDRGRLPRDARGGRGGRLRQRVHVRLLAARRHRGRGDARPGAARGEDRAHGAARRGRPARCARERNEARVGRVEEVLVEGPSRTDESLLRGRTRRNTTVNFTGDAQRGRARRRR